MRDLISEHSLTIPRGTPNLGSYNLDMTEVYRAESRLAEVRTASPLTAPELMGFFNEACNLTTKYVAWIEFEILQAKKYLDLAKATVILDKAPEEFKRLKDTGIKYNEDFREAIVMRDAEYQERLDIVNALTATKAFLENKSWSFIRAYNACKYVATSRQVIAAAPQLNGNIGQTYDEPQSNFMGVTKLD